MSKLQDPAYLQGEQYRDAVNLNARIILHSRFSTNQYGWFKWVFDHFEIGPKARILELGCGPGDLWLQNENRLPRGWRIALSDFSPGMVSQARDNIGWQAQRFFLTVIDAQAIPFDGGGFDAVIANHVLFHVPDRKRAFAEIRRVLKTGGRFYATTIGENHQVEMTDLLRRFDPTVEDVFKSDERPFTLENGGKQLQAWFSEVALDRYPDSLRVSEVPPLVDYLLSSVHFQQAEDRRQMLTAFLTAEIAARDGAIQIKKDSGIFTALKR
jgi:SAM-dependent methyltransferase